MSQSLAEPTTLQEMHARFKSARARMEGIPEVVRFRRELEASQAREADLREHLSKAKEVLARARTPDRERSENADLRRNNASLISELYRDPWECASQVFDWAESAA